MGPKPKNSLPKRSSLTLAERVQVIEESRKNVSQRDLAKKFKCGKSQIQRILQNQQGIINEWTVSSNSLNKRKLKPKRKQTYEDVNSQVLKWFREVTGQKIPVNGPSIQEKAKHIAEQLGAAEFKASNGWLEAFRKRNNIALKTIPGQAADADVGVGVKEQEKRMPELSGGYEAKDIFNMDVTALLFRTIPDNTLIEKGKQCIGGKISKERITVVLCCSATGEKMKPLVIYKSIKPACFKNVNINNLGVQWAYNRKCWMTSEIFLDWLRKLNAKMVSEDRQIIMLLNNANFHPKQTVASNVKILFLPQNTTCYSQPLAQGIIQAMKLQYRKRMLRKLVTEVDDVSSAAEMCTKITVLDACNWVRDAWSCVSEATITKCFAKCGIKSATQDEEDDDQGEAHELDCVRRLGHQIGLVDLVIDENIQNTSQETPDDDTDDSSEDEEEGVQPVPINEAMDTMGRLRALVRELTKADDSYAMRECDRFENYLQDLIIKYKTKNTKRTLAMYFNTTNK